MMPSVLLLVTELADEKGGIAQVNRSLLQSLLELQDVQLVVVSLHDRSGDKHSGFELICCSGSYLYFTLLVLFKSLFAQLVISGHVRLLTPLLWVNLCRTPYVVFGHGSEVTHRLKDSSRRVMHRAARVIANSERTAKRITRFVDNLQPVTCPLGLVTNAGLAVQEPQLFSALGGAFKVGRRMLLLVGRMEPKERQKGKTSRTCM